MRKNFLFFCWLLAPVALLAFHYGPGQASLARDNAARHVAVAQALERGEDWKGAQAAYAAALALVPVQDRVQRRQLRLAQGKARMVSGELPESIADMQALLAEAEKEGGAKAEIHEIRANLGSAEYYAGWLMRLEGAPTEEWSVQVENARQHFRLLAEEKLATGNPGAKGSQEDLEATIRLARMDLSELEGMPLPKFCQGCKNVSQKCRGQCESKAKKPAEGTKDARGASSGERPRGGS